MNIERITALVAAAVAIAQQLTRNRDIREWAKQWVECIDRSATSAAGPRNIMIQRLNANGERNDDLAVYFATCAAWELAQATEWGNFRAKTDAELALEHANQARYTLRPRDYTEPELVLDDWNYGPGGWRYGSKRGRSYFPDEV